MSVLSNPFPERTQVWSCGGGTQSVAIAALIVQGVLPKPDFSVIVDTGHEKGSTWEYAEATLIPELRRVGVELQRVLSEQYATVGLYAKNGTLLMPVFTTQGQNEKPGKFTNFCSYEWKRRVVQRWLRAQGVQECVNWVGISTNELGRASLSRQAWFQHYYPLLDLRKSRQDCVSLVRAMGWPDPPRSACYDCPNQGNSEWLETQQNRPDEWAAAVARDYALREKDPHVYLHGSGLPLDQADLTLDAGGGGLFGCTSGYCFV